jgi:hypothetical protein
VRIRTWVAILAGATLGALIGLAVLALAGGLVIQQGVGATLLDSESLRARAEFVVTRGAFDVLVLVAGAVGGAALGALGYVIGREAGDDNRRMRPGPLILIGAFLGALVAFGAAHATLGLAGSGDAGLLTVSVYRMILVAMIAGAAAGGVVGGTIERISQPEVLGLEGEAWPANPVLFVKEALTAVGLPILGTIVGIGFVWLLSEVLLGADHVTALIVFGGVAALVLFGATIIAARPPTRGTEQ